MLYRSSVLSLFVSLTLFAKNITFHGDGRPEATLSAQVGFSDSENASPIHFDFDLPGLELEAADSGFSQITAKNLFGQDVAGTPDLGVSGSLFVIPPGYEPELQIIQTETKEVANTLIAPNQHRVRCDCPENRSFHFDASLYKSSSLYPSSVATLQNVGYFQNAHFGRLHLQPIQQDFLNRRLVVTTRLRAVVSFKRVARFSPKILSPLAAEYVRRLAPNASDALDNQTPSSLETMVIFTHENYVSALKPFIEWKKLRGIDVKLFTLTQVGGTREKAKEFLQKFYDESTVKPSYLLIVGNKVTFPAFEEKTTTGAGTQIAITDYPYSLLSGQDGIPDVLHGRLLVSSSEELEVYLNKIMTFERRPESQDWYAKGTTIASNEPHNPGPGITTDKMYALNIQEALKKHSFKEMDSFFQGDQTAKEQSLLDAVNQGRSWITYLGHGSGISWGSMNDRFSVESIAKLTNHRHPVLIDIACQNANFQTHEKPFGKAWMVQTYDGKPAGAVGYYGGSVNISWHPPAIMSVGIAKTHFEKPVHSFGGSVLHGQLYLIEQKGTGEETLDNLRWFNLFGDPSLLIRTDFPKKVTVERGFDDHRGNFQVRVAVNGAPIQNAVASVIDSEGKITSVKTNENGIAQLPFADRLVVSGYNLETFETQLD